jgi:6-phosphogluconolactonase (cycloisomerase 2 family)
MDVDSGRWQALGVVAGIGNPSWLTVHPNKKYLYSVHGGLMSDVSAFGIRDAGLEHLGTWPSGGVNPVHLDVHSLGEWAVVANYTGATVAVLPVAQDGRLAEPSDVVPLQGPQGPDAVEQSAPHPHDIPFHPSGAFLAVPDKGLDSVFIFRLDLQKGRFLMADPPFVRSAPGAGPRHIAFHPSRAWAYVINELGSTLSVYRFKANGDAFQELGTVSSLPGDAGGRSTGSEVAVHPSGRFVYLSNRGHNSVAAFGINQKDGHVTPIGWYPTHGDTPRAIALDPAGRFLYAANQGSDTIYGFRVDDRDGSLAPIGLVAETGSPASMVFV